MSTAHNRNEFSQMRLTELRQSGYSGPAFLLGRPAHLYAERLRRRAAVGQ